MGCGASHAENRGVGVGHPFRDTGDEPVCILWIYDVDHVTRTFAATGRTVEHLSPDARVVED
jgi:hypothetical protein